MNSRWTIWILIAAFFVGLLPYAATFTIRYPDERFYIDGAIFMAKDGDFTTPRWPDRTPRFEKPVLTYWIVALGYAVAGISIFGARLPFLIAGCVILYLTYRIAWRVFKRREIGILAGLILLSHLQFILCSTRSIPDVILVFFSLISAYGFIRLIVFEEKKMSAYWAAYGGAALAFAAKGLLPLVLVAFAWGFAFFTKRSLKRLVHIPSMLFAVAAVVAWFGYSYLAHGDSALNVFWGDQVAKKVTSLWAPFYRIPLFLLIYVLNFLPWSLPIIESRLRNRDAFNSEDKIQKGFRQFAVAWAVTIAVIFGFGKNVSIRYLLPATPLLAMCLADVLYRCASAKLIFSPANLLKFMLALLAIVGALAFWINWQLEAVTYATIALVLVLAMIFGLGWFGLGKKFNQPKIALAFSIFLLFPTLFASLYHVVFPDEAQQITRKLMDSSIASGEPILVINDLSLANRIRVYSRGQIEVRKAKFLDPATVPTYAGIVSWGDQTEQLRALGFDIQKISTAIKNPHAEDLLKASLTGKLRELRESRKMDYFLAIPQKRVAIRQS